MFTKNLKLKLISLILAISLEFYFISPTNLIVSTLRVPIEVVNIPPYLMMVSPDGGEDGLHTDVKIRGPAPLIDQARAAPHRFVVRIPDDVGNERGFQLRFNPSQLGLPSGVSMIESSPDALEVKLEAIVKRGLKVSSQHEGEVPPGFELEQIKITPDAVMATGPESELKGLKEIETELVDLSDMRQSRILDLPLITKGPKTVVSPSSVRVEFVVVPKKAERTFDGLEIQMRSSRGLAATLEPTRAKVVLKGETAAVAAASARNLTLFVDLAGLAPGEHDVAIQVENLSVPQSPELQVARIVPDRVKVKIFGKRSK